MAQTIEQAFTTSDAHRQAIPASEVERPALRHLGAVSLNRISKSFGETQILKGLDLAITPGEFITILGPSGCGKSTLLRIIAGLARQDTGTVEIDGQQVDGRPPNERDIAMVFQSYALYPSTIRHSGKRSKAINASSVIHIAMAMTEVPNLFFTRAATVTPGLAYHGPPFRSRRADLNPARRLCSFSRSACAARAARLLARWKAREA
jgi:ABC-type transport system involved in cytochrome bd biosynthesis fused ATPase/permease subunit